MYLWRSLLIIGFLINNILPIDSFGSIKTIPGNQSGIVNTLLYPVAVFFSDDGKKFPDNYTITFSAAKPGKSAQLELIPYRRHVRIHNPSEGDRATQVFEATITKGNRYAIVIEDNTGRRVLRSHRSNTP